MLCNISVGKTAEVSEEVANPEGGSQSDDVIGEAIIEATQQQTENREENVLLVRQKELVSYLKVMI